MQAPTTRLSRLVARVYRYPAWVRRPLLSLGIGRTVKFVGTSGIQFEEMTASWVVVSLANRPKVRNHIGQIHAAAMTLLAETATDMVMGMNVPDDRVPVIKSFTVHFEKRTQGAMRASATLQPEQIELIQTSEKGETLVPVEVTDASGGQPIRCEMLWAWVPKKRPAKTESPLETSPVAHG